MQRTRRQILDILKKSGRATLDELAREVGLSPVTVRVHLSVLQRDDLVRVDEVRGRVGRPFFTYSLSEEAEDLFPKRYHVLAHRLLHSLSATLPAADVQAVMGNVAAQWASEYAQRLTGKGPAERVAEVSRIRSEEGAIADWDVVEGGFLLRQFNCPNLAVSRVHQQVCDVEEKYLATLLQLPVTRIDCIGRGDRLCSYHIRESSTS